MVARLLLIASVCSACSLDGLADGAGAQGGAPTTTSTGGAGGDGGSPVGAGGAGGGPAMSRFVWIESIGNAETQATSPFATDPNGASLRMSEPDASGAVWLALVTVGELDPDGAGPFIGGAPGFHGLFLVELQADGSVTAFQSYLGPPEDIDNGLVVDDIVRSGAGVGVVGTFRTGTIDFGIGTITQPNTTADDGFLLVADEDGQAIAARHFTGLSNDTQTARALASFGGKLFVGGKLKQSFSIVDVSDDTVEATCAFEDTKEVFERAYVALFDETTLACEKLQTLTAVDSGAAQQVFGVAADASGVYLAGSYTRQLIAAPLPAMPATAAAEGFVVALQPDLTPVWTARATSGQGTGDDALRSIFIAGTKLVVGGYLEDGTGPQLPSFGRVQTGTVCTFTEGPTDYDGFVGILTKNSGDCTAATLLDANGVDQVRAVAPDGDGVLATGFTDGFPGLETTAADPSSRSGFLARLDSSLIVTGGAAIGGTSLDYVDGARAVDGGFLVAGSYGVPFDVLESERDFFVGKIELE